MLKRKSYLFDQCGIKYERRYPSGSGVKARVLTTRQRVGDRRWRRIEWDFNEENDGLRNVENIGNDAVDDEITEENSFNNTLQLIFENGSYFMEE